MPVLETEFRYDIEKLLSPISPENPAGVSLRYDPAYDRIKDLRREDDATLPQGIWKTEQKRADWSSVEAACLDAIETRSKDLQIAAWLLEAWLHMHAFGGAAEGFGLLLALCESYWDGLHPRIEGGDVEFRIAPLIWINKKLPVALKLCPLTAPQSDDLPSYAWADWELACQSDNVAAKPGTPSAQRVTLASFHQSVTLTPTPHFRGILADVERMIVNCEKLELLLDEKLRKESPGLVALRSAGESIGELLNSILHQRVGSEPALSHSGQEPDNGDFNENGGHDPGPFSRIRSRTEAYQLLAEAAEFLERTEPHSPAPYLVRRAIAWGSMQLAELLPELIRNPGELSEIYRLLNLNGSVDDRRK